MKDDRHMTVIDWILIAILALGVVLFAVLS